MANFATNSHCQQHLATPTLNDLRLWLTNMKIPQLYAALKKKREFERLEMPFVSSLLDFDIIIEIGYAQEQKWRITPKQLLLLKLSSDRTARRRLASLVAQGVVLRQMNPKDHRSEVLILSPSSARVLEKYGRLLLSLGDAIS